MLYRYRCVNFSGKCRQEKRRRKQKAICTFYVSIISSHNGGHDDSSQKKISWDFFLEMCSIKEGTIAGL